MNANLRSGASGAGMIVTDLDGYAWVGATHERKDIEGFKALAQEVGAELWMRPSSRHRS